MTKAIWKVCRLDGSGRYISVAVLPPFMLYYNLGEWTYPKIGEIFCFNRKLEAEQFMRPTNANTYLLKGVSTETRTCPLLIPIEYHEPEIVRRYWSDREFLLYTKWGMMASPAGSVLCRDFMPQEVVKGADR